MQISYNRMATILGIWLFFISFFLHYFGFKSGKFLAFIALMLLAFSFSLNSKPSWPFKTLDLLSIASDLSIFLRKKYVVVLLHTQRDFVTGCSDKSRVLVTLCTQLGHDDNGREVFLRVFSCNFSKFEFIHSFIGSNMFKDLLTS